MVVCWIQISALWFRMEIEREEGVDWRREHFCARLNAVYMCSPMAMFELSKFVVPIACLQTATAAAAA